MKFEHLMAPDTMCDCGNDYSDHEATDDGVYCFDDSDQQFTPLPYDTAEELKRGIGHA